MKKPKLDIGSILLWGGVTTIFFWALLKSLGIIQSPIWVEMAPYFGLAAAFGGAGAKLNNLIADFKGFKYEVRGDFKELREKIHEIDKDVHSLKKKK